MKICVAGVYDPEETRNRILLRLLRNLGASLVEVTWREHTPSSARRRAQNTLRGARTLLETARATQPDIIFVPYPGHYAVPIARWVGKRLNIPIVFDAFVSVHDTVIRDRRLFAERSARAALYRLVDRLSIRCADTVLVDTPQHAELFETLTGAPAERFHVVPIGFEDDRFPESTQTPPSANTVLFYGTFIPLHGVDTIVRAAHLLARRGVRFKLIGSGQTHAQSVGLAQRLNLTNIEWQPLLAYADVAQEIEKASICLGIFGTSEKAGNVVPNKVYECVATGRPVVTRASEAISWAFPGDTLCTVPPGNPQALAHAIADVLDHPEASAHRAQSALRRLRERFGENTLRRDLTTALTHALGSRSRDLLPNDAP